MVKTVFDLNRGNKLFFSFFLVFAFKQAKEIFVENGATLKNVK